MAQEGTPEVGLAPPEVQLFEFSVVLVASNNNPSIVNPDFLLNNGIITDLEPLRERSIATPMFSLAMFKGNVNVKAEPNRVIFEQTGTPLTVDRVICAEIAKRYLKTVPHVPYSAIGINPKSYRTRSRALPSAVVHALIGRGTWMAQDSTVPTFGLKAIYQYPDRRIIFDASEGEAKIAGETSSVDFFEANIHRDIKEQNQQMRISSLLSLLDTWRDDYSDFITIVSKLDHGLQD